MLEVKLYFERPDNTTNVWVLLASCEGLISAIDFVRNQAPRSALIRIASSEHTSAYFVSPHWPYRENAMIVNRLSGYSLDPLDEGSYFTYKLGINYNYLPGDTSYRNLRGEEDFNWKKEGF